MSKTNYIATDAAGGIHKRSTESRAYTHTVVVKGGYEAALASAKSPGWAKTDASNFDYYLRIAEGRSAHYPSKRWCAAPRHTPEQIAQEDADLAVSDAAKVAVAKLETDGRTVDQYVAIQRDQRIKRVEARKAAGDFDTWKNAGWCGRLDLAQKLAASEAAKGDYAVDILAAKEA
jgi:hypothetical protein